MRLQVVVTAILLVSCGQGAEHKENNATGMDNKAVVYDTSLSTGTVKDTILCKNDAAQAYSLYLPKGYTSQRAWPCILFFDAHARGALPVRMYKDIAEKYGVILIGSNTSKNGLAPEITEKIIASLWNDIHSRINIDSDRTYTSGFSGGSKVAGMAAMTHSGIAGVIGCAGGLPNTGQAPQHAFNYFGIAGDDDFNQPEMMQLDSYLEQQKQPHFLLTWQGIHTWPPVNDFKTGVLWMLVSSMKAHKMDRNDAVITDLTIELNKRISQAIMNNDPTTAARLLNGTSAVFDGLTDVTGYKKQTESIVNNGTYIYSLQTLQQLQQQEQKQCHEMATQFTTQNEQWWSKKITELNQHAGHSKKVQESNSTRRVLAFLGFISYMNVSHALSTGDMTHAISYLNIFKMADPKNPDCSYFSALVRMKNTDSKTAMNMLNEAAALGYSDIEQLNAEPAFTGLHNEHSFQQIVQKVRDNHDGKTLVH